MSEESLLLALRNTVVDCTDRYLGNEAKALPDDTNQAWPAEEEVDALSACLFIIALRMLENKGRLCALTSNERQLSAMKAGDIAWLAKELHARLQDFAPDDDVIPVAPSQKTITSMHGTLLADRELSALLHDQSSLGYAYQFLCGYERKRAQTKIQSANKTLSLRNLVAFTQLYTPGWIVDYLLANTILPLWQEEEKKGATAISSWLSTQQSYAGMKYEASLINVLDPACGCGHFLLRAFDLLRRLHELEGYSSDEAIASVLRYNLAGADIDPLAVAVTALGLLVKCLSLSDNTSLKMPGLSCMRSHTADGAADLMGSLSRQLGDTNHVLAQQYAAVVTNPPYIGRKLLSREFRNALKSDYPDCHHDLCAAFVRRSLEWLKPQGGRIGLITQASLLSLPSYGALRAHILRDHKLVSSVDLGAGVFPLQSGEKVNSVLLIAETPRTTSGETALFLDVTRSRTKAEDLKEAIVRRTPPPAQLKRYEIDPDIFARLPHTPFNYACPSRVLQASLDLPALSTAADVRQGLATTDNGRFVRHWWDVAPQAIGSVWFPYVKGAGSERWYSPVRFLVRWENEGAEIKRTVSETYPYLKGNVGWVVKNERFYFKPGLCFSFVNTHEFCVRDLPAGCIFDVAASAVFTRSENDDRFLLAYLNSSFVAAVARGLNPTINFQVGDIKRLPMLPFSKSQKERLGQLGESCVTLKKQLSSLNGSSFDLTASEQLRNLLAADDDPAQNCAAIVSLRRSLENTLLDFESEINEIVLTAAQAAMALSDKEGVAVRAWVDDTSQRKRASGSTLSQLQIAQMALHDLLMERLKKDGALSIGTSAKEQLGLNDTTASWLETLLESDLHAYLAAKHNQFVSKFCFKNPPYFTQRLSGDEPLLLFSTQALRSDISLPQTIGNPARHFLQNLKSKLAGIRDFAGADVLQALKASKR